ncbi:MAG: tungstate ABC transporter substrate-binding protein WtpA, partial [Thermoprotei archaeon]
MLWKFIAVAAIIVAIIIGVGVIFYMKPYISSTTNTPLVPTIRTNVSNISGYVIVFCAGSLYIPLQELKEVFEEKFPGVEVVIEPSGSVMAVRKVVELNRRCDVIALADYRLIPKYMMPNYAKWYVAFATNEIVLCYTNKSKYADKINADNWYEILLRPDVRYGFSNPNDDPCGYRALTVLGLASLLYGENILDKLVLSRTNIKAKEVDGELHIYVPSELEVYSENPVIRSKSVDLIALLEAGALDYAFEYRSVAV